MARSTLQAIFRGHFAQYAQGQRLPMRAWRAANAIMACRTGELGGHVLSCPQQHVSQVHYNACHHRSCPQCAGVSQQRWVESELQRLLPCEHYHAVFTLPHQFIPLWEHNRSAMNTLLFNCARQSLLELCADERFMGATPGVLMALHSWGRTLSRHPHVHCLVSGGGLDAQGQWRDCRNGYLVPVKALASLYRGKLLHQLSQALQHQSLTLPEQQPLAYWRHVIRTQWRKHWNVHLAEPYAHGRGVALYLARYVKGGAIGTRRVLHNDEQRVGLAYTDHRDGQAKWLNLAHHEFIERVLWHAAPKGQHMTRHCGLYAGRAHEMRRRAAQLLEAPPAPLPTLAPSMAWHDSVKAASSACPVCLRPLVCTARLLPLHRTPPSDVHRHGEYSIPTSRAGMRLGPTRRSTGHANAPASTIQPTSTPFLGFWHAG